MMDGTTETNRAAGGGLAEIGVMLRKRREEVGQNLATIAATTHIRQNYLKAIEEGRRKDLPGTAYMIGYIRTYADYLGFDGDRLIADFHADLAGQRKWVDKRAEAAEPPAASGMSHVQISPAMGLVAVLALVVVIYGAWAFISDDEGGTETASVEAPEAAAPDQAAAPAVEPTTKPSTPSPAVAEASAPAEPDPAPVAAAPGTTEDQVPPEADIASTGEDVVEESPPQPEPALEAEGQAGKIVIRARLESWIQIANAKKEVVFSRVLRAGETYTVPEEAGLMLTTGNAGGVEILLNGKKLKSLGTVGLVKRDVPLDAKKLKDGSAFKTIKAAPATN